MRRHLLKSAAEHPLVDTLIHLKGNARACVYTEPLWGIPYNLYIPFFTVYMYALGVNDRQIGLLLSLGMFFQVFAALLGGVLTDKLGRRLTTVIFDTISWSVPTLIWAVAQNFWWFLIAAIFNSMWQITNNSWNCLLVEDCEKSKLVHVYTWCTISGLLAVFFAPVSGILVDRLTIVPAVRIVFAFTFIVMTSKFIILFFNSTETKQGVVRKRETKGVPISQMLVEYKDLARIMLQTPHTVTLLGVMVTLNITAMVTTNFFALYVTQNLGIPEQYLAFFPIGRALVMLIFIFSIQTILNRLQFHVPVMVGIMLYIASQFVLLTAPAGQLLFLIIYVLCEAFAFALVTPQKESMMVVFVDPHERARIVSLIYVTMIGISAPFGWIAGELSQRNRHLPFMLNIALYGVCAVLIFYMRVLSRKSSSQDSQ